MFGPVWVWISAAGVNSSDGRRWCAGAWRERHPVRTFCVFDELEGVFALVGITPSAVLRRTTCV